MDAHRELLHLHDGVKLVIGMVGLPGRGKTYTARKVARYLSWIGYSSRVFNIGNYRRSRLGSDQSWAFFDPNNAAGAAARQEMARAALEDMVGWLRAGGEVGIYDGTNSTRERRAFVMDRIGKEPNMRVLWIENVCDDDEVIEANIRETKLSSPDYKDMDAERAIEDFRHRIAVYKKAYVPVDDSAASYIKLINAGQSVLTNNIHGYLASKIVSFLMHLHTIPRPILLCRPGDTLGPRDRMGGDDPLSPAGEAVAQALADFVRHDTSVSATKLVVWASPAQRAVATARDVPCKQLVTWKTLHQLDCGVCDGMTLDEFESKMPEEYYQRTRDKLRFRFPRGESYLDVKARLEPVIFELERQRNPVLVVSHRPVLRCLYSYFMDLPAERMPHLPFPNGCVIRITPKAYGCVEQRIKLEPVPRMLSPATVTAAVAATAVASTAAVMDEEAGGPRRARL